MSEGRRVDVQIDALAPRGRPGSMPGTIAYEEFAEAWRAYAALSPSPLSEAEVATKGGFTYSSLVRWLGREPVTFIPTNYFGDIA